MKSNPIEGFIESWLLKTTPIPKHLITKDNLLQTNYLGFSLLHIAAKMGQLKDVPEELLVYDYLMRKDAHGKSVMACAAEGGYIEQVPKSLITPNTLCAYGDPPVIHCLALRGELGKLPETFITQEVMSTTDKQGNTVFHAAATSGVFNAIPAHLLTDDNLFETNKFDYSVLDLMYVYVDPIHIPEKFKSQEALLNLGVEKRHLSKIVEQCYMKKDFSILKKLIKNFSKEGLDIIMKDYCMEPHDVAKQILKEREVKEAMTKSYQKESQEGLTI
jgi:hypothetical protein